MARIYWTKESIFAEARKFKTRNEFKHGSPKGYMAAIRHDILQEACKHMEYVREEWTKEKILREARKFRTIKEFERGSRKAYDAARHHGIADEAFAHMVKWKRPIMWTDEKIAAEAKRYSARLEFQRGTPSAYNRAFKLGILDRVCAHMPALKMSWTDQLIAERAKKYKSRVDFMNYDLGAYSSGRARGILDDVCAHMEPLYEPWDADKVMVNARRYKSRLDFMTLCPKGYAAARRLNMLDEACSHMEFLSTGFDKSKAGIVYYLRVETETRTLYKIGITNKTVSERFKFETAKFTVLKTWKFSDGKKAYEKERSVLRTYSVFRYVGPNVLTCNGNTELFTEDVLGLDPRAAIAA